MSRSRTEYDNPSTDKIHYLSHDYVRVKFTFDRPIPLTKTVSVTECVFNMQRHEAQAILKSVPIPYTREVSGELLAYVISVEIVK